MKILLKELSKRKFLSSTLNERKLLSNKVIYVLDVSKRIKVSVLANSKEK